MLQIYEMLCLGASLKKTKGRDVLENGAFASASNVFGVRGHTLIMLEHKGTQIGQIYRRIRYNMIYKRIDPHNL